MTSGLRLSTKLLLPAILLISPLVSAAPAPEHAAALVRSLARPVPAQTAYTEVRFIGLLTRPLVLRGEMAWLGGDRLTRSVVSPYPETTAINGDQATIQRGTAAPRHFSLDHAPELRDLLDAFVALLSGNAPALERSFELQAYGNAAAWTLDLVPRNARIGKRIRAISIDGRGTAMRCMRVDQGDGDTSFTLMGALGSVALPAKPTPAALVRLCAGAG